jgi:modulator of FtsH protease
VLSPTAYSTFEWGGLFLTAAGASAALAGLVFVAVSINLERILRYKGLADRALETLLLLILVLLVSLAGLVPGQSNVALGIELLVLGGIVGYAIARMPIDSAGVSDAWLAGRWGVRVAGTEPFGIGGLSLIAESGGGLYWVAAGFALAIAGAVTNAWVVLVEILR